jgi:hypothetical protein
MKAYLKFYSYNKSYVFSNENLQGFSNQDFEFNDDGKINLREKVIKFIKSLKCVYTPSDTNSLKPSKDFSHMCVFLEHKIKENHEEIIETTAGLVVSYTLIDSSKLIKI